MNKKVAEKDIEETRRRLARMGVKITILCNSGVIILCAFLKEARRL